MKYALILAAGNGTRMESDIPKQFLSLTGEPLFLRSVRTFSKLCDKVIVVTRETDIDYVNELLANKELADTEVIPGGTTRFESSFRGLQKISELIGDQESQGDDLVLIHDAARPFVSEDVIKRTLTDAEMYGAAVTAVPVKDTIKKADNGGFSEETLDREKLWAVQTPQGFRFSVIYEAYKKASTFSEVMENGTKDGHRITDDGMVVELFSDSSVRLTLGDYDNIKITTKEDLRFLDK